MIQCWVEEWSFAAAFSVVWEQGGEGRDRERLGGAGSRQVQGTEPRASGLAASAYTC